MVRREPEQAVLSFLDIDSTSGTTTVRHLRRIVGWSSRTRTSCVSGRAWREESVMELPRGVALDKMASGEVAVRPIAAVELPAGVGVVMLTDVENRAGPVSIPCGRVIV